MTLRQPRKYKRINGSCQLDSIQKINPRGWPVPCSSGASSDLRSPARARPARQESPSLISSGAAPNSSRSRRLKAGNKSEPRNYDTYPTDYKVLTWPSSPKHEHVRLPSRSQSRFSLAPESTATHFIIAYAVRPYRFTASANTPTLLTSQSFPHGVRV